MVPIIRPTSLHALRVRKRPAEAPPETSITNQHLVSVSCSANAARNGLTAMAGRRGSLCMVQLQQSAQKSSARTLALLHLSWCAVPNWPDRCSPAIRGMAQRKGNNLCTRWCFIPHGIVQPTTPHEDKNSEVREALPVLDERRKKQ